MLAQTLPFCLILVGCILLSALFSGCSGMAGGTQGDSFEKTLDILEKNTDIVLLTDATGGEKVVVAPEFSARVMMAAWAGENAPRLGWVNAPVVTGDERNPAFINYGGAERLWLSPEGGQFALFFKPGESFDLDHWWTPHTFNSDPYEIVEKSGTRIAMAREMALENYQGTPFSFRVLRTVSLVERAALSGTHGVTLPETVRFVGYSTENTLINRAYSAMSAEKGLVSLWILSQYDATPNTWVLFPFETEGGDDGAPLVNDDYFGKVPAERLITETDLGCAFFRCDGRRRTKIGLSFGRAKNVIGSIDFDRNILTVVTFNLPRDGSYAANTWTIQDAPFKGDVVNSYNNGLEGEDADVPECFYELETLSPVKELPPGYRLVHENTTLHFGGSLEELNPIAVKMLGVDLFQVRDRVDAPGKPQAAGEENAPADAPADEPGAGRSRVPEKSDGEERFR